MSLASVDARTGPRKLLALDGGGIRGLMTVEFLAGLEELLRQERRKAGALGENEPFVLADYFDYIAGTSTGGILAAGLSIGLSCDELREFYVKSGKQMFDKASLLRRFKTKYDDKALAEKLQEVFEHRTLGDESIRTYLMMVLRNASRTRPGRSRTTPGRSTTIAAGPTATSRSPSGSSSGPARRRPRTSPPRPSSSGNGAEHVFVDGGVTMYNNPAFQLFLMATLEPYRLQWETGEDRMLVVSVGTGKAADANKDLAPSDMNLLYNATSIPSALMYAALNEQDLLCRVFGRCLVGDELDREIGDLIGVDGPARKQFTYLRYNAELTREGLDDLGLQRIEPDQVSALDSLDGMPQLQKLGKALAEKRLDPAHYKGFLA